ncbi:ectonucleotide pyrophosphatase/phosphodiesterase family member 3-like isoform X1 [Acropora millepora]|uniref:ectonucleotide pyrophosphatase/phosphodiesterase family member 3-like isoform X1 n=2 Tax=Acropora millepora TaxID=45264 RepID=UPI001CF4A273|nr:ectonucleotide pyrophosphatase/phosphodiesterase family member 3-like isoform X1 [Acropora millepora]
MKASRPMLASDDERKYSLRIDYGAQCRMRSFFGLSKKLFAFVVAVVLVLLLLIILLVVFLTKSPNEGEKARIHCPEWNYDTKYPLILISMDGFRPDYLDRNITPNINYLARNGVRAKFLRPQFPTKTFPNHYSIVTGLFPAHHGIVANRFTDKNFNDSFKIGGASSSNPKWWGGEPLWVTAIKQGLVSACYFWVGSDVPIEGILPNKTYKYTQSIPFEARVDTVLSWLDLPPQGRQISDPEKDNGRRPNFITLYFHEPDYTAHRHGPDAEQTNAKIKVVDNMIGRLWNGLKDRCLEDKINIIMVGDHGMSQTSCERVVYIDKYNVTLNDIQSSQQYGGPFMSIDPKSGISAEDIVNRLHCKSPHLRVFLKKDLPKRLHYSLNRRIGQIILIAEDEWLIGTNASAGYRYCKGGAHGYDNLDVNMRALFVAHGPSFKKGEVVESFQNNELYDMMAGILGLKPAPNDGTPGSLSHLLKPGEAHFEIINSDGDGKQLRTDICQYPQKTSSCSGCVCPYCQVNSTAVARYEKMLNLTDDQKSHIIKTHLPWGVPKGGAGDGGCILNQQDFVTGYSTSLHLPLWVAYTLHGEKSSQFSKRRNCFRRDIRLTDMQASHCTDYSRSGFDRGHMAPNADFDTFDVNDESVMNSFLLSNIAPQLHGFNAGIWLFAEKMVRDLSVTFSSVNVMSGAIFDEDADGQRDEDSTITRWLKNDTSSVAIPTHFYKIIVRCDTDKKPYHKVPECQGRLDVISFILPHLAKQPCPKHQSSEEYLLQNTARVRDIELLTGISFFSGLPPAEQARLKTISPSKLW